MEEKIKIDKNTVEEKSRTIKLSKKEKIVYDFSKTHLSGNDIAEFKRMLSEKGLSNKIDEMWDGNPINYTENRPVLHYLLRCPPVLNEVSDTPVCPDLPTHTNSQVAQTAKAEIVEELRKVKQFCKEFESARGITGKALKTIVNIGIGGSDLGPKMVAKAFPSCHFMHREAFFISNVDASAALETFSRIEPAETLFIVVSKTFTTAETIANFKLAMKLFSERTGIKDEKEICAKHFVAVSSNLAEVKKYGISKTFAMWDYVGGRYSLWSPVGLSIALYLGFPRYLEMLAGAAAVDAEFYERRVDSLPAILAMVEAYYVRHGYTNKCIASYDIHLELLYKYLQQAEMESNGKRGSPQMVIWGGVGTDVQHSFFQQLHQGDQKVYTEFLLPVRATHLSAAAGCCDKPKEVMELLEEHQKVLIANCLAQSRALLVGKDDSNPNKVCPGNRPSTTILFSELTPRVLGAILAVYEHKIFVTGVLYGINSFDQFGVQLGKVIANELRSAIDDQKEEMDASTMLLLQHISNMME